MGSSAPSPEIPEVSDQDLQDMINREAVIEQDWLQVLELMFPYSIEQFYNNFFADDAPFGLDAFSKRKNHRDISIE